MPRASRAMTMAMGLAGNKEGNGKGSKGNDNCDKGVGQRTATATKRPMITVTRVGGNEEGNGDKEGNGDSNKGGRQQRR
jgi:hypothetical protein